MTATVSDTDTLAAVEHELWLRIGYLVLLAPKVIALKAKLDSDDPVFAFSPKRPDAEARYEMMRIRRHSCMARIAALWEALDDDGREPIARSFESGDISVSGIQFANAVWAAAKVTGAGPFGPAPF